MKVKNNKKYAGIIVAAFKLSITDLIIIRAKNCAAKEECSGLLSMKSDSQFHMKHPDEMKFDNEVHSEHVVGTS